MLELAGSGDGLTGPIVTAAAHGRATPRRVHLHHHGPLARPRLGEPGGRTRPVDLRHRRRGVAAGELLIRPAREEFAHTLTGRGFRPQAEVELVALGPEAGLVGAADLARQLRPSDQRG